ncbi:C40 family peptidase [Haloechinothrix salitolerans]|uniref:C40 family peptidase n=1 Tax=Haloechinothrix salitolerans TaxID=926830 RepID=A0ABW2C7B2_9PSEU
MQKAIAGAAVAAVLAVLTLAGVIGGTVAAVVSGADGPTRCVPSGSAEAQPAGYGAEQLSNAGVIVAVGKQLRIPQRGWVVAVTAAMQESRLRNVDYGDRDSLGLFQQRPSQGWGTPAQIMNPSYATTQFYQHLQNIPSWERMSVNDAAQAVQRSGFPNAYSQHESAARTIVAALNDATCAPIEDANRCMGVDAPSSAARVVLKFVCGQLGVPYEWGGDGPANGHAGFDCSGLTTAAYAAAGIRLPRTAHTQYHATARVSEAELQPGDLVFYGNPNIKVHHVGIYIGNGQMIDAPTFGEPIGIRPVRWGANDDFAGGGRLVN